MLQNASFEASDYNFLMKQAPSGAYEACYGVYKFLKKSARPLLVNSWIRHCSNKQLEHFPKTS